MATTWYFSTTGTFGGAGTQGDPWDITAACTKAGPVAGDTIQGDGTFTGNFNVTRVCATPSIYIRNTPGQVLNIIGSIALATAGKNHVLWGNGLGFRVNGNGQHLPQAEAAVDLLHDGAKAINLVAHDGEIGIGYWSSAPNGLAYGNIVYNNGYHDDSGSGLWGDNFYGQTDGTNPATYEENILFHAKNAGFHNYSQSGHVNNITWSGNIEFYGGAQGSLIGGSSTASKVAGFTMTEHEGYGYATQFGYAYGDGAGEANTDATITNNYLVSCNSGESGDGYLIHTVYFANVTCTGNTMVRKTKASNNFAINTLNNAFGDQNPLTYTWDNNTYYVENPAPTPYTWSDLTGAHPTTFYSLATWRSTTGHDLASTQTSALPTVNRVKVRPNAYETGRANIAAYNWQGTSTVTADVSAVLATNDQYAVYHVYDLDNPVASGTYTGVSITIPMTGLPSAPVPVLGWAGASFPDLTAGTAQFGAFVLLKTGTFTPSDPNAGNGNTYSFPNPPPRPRWPGGQKGAVRPIRIWWQSLMARLRRFVNSVTRFLTARGTPSAPRMSPINSLGGGSK